MLKTLYLLFLVPVLVLPNKIDYTASPGEEQTVPWNPEELQAIDPPHLRYLQLAQRYFYEVIGLLLLLIYILNYYTGKKLNLQILTRWLFANRPIFEQNFSHIGVSPLQGGTEGGALFDEESCYTYKFYASGRVNCDYCLVTLDLKKRQDLLTMLVFNLIWIERDKVIIDIPINLARKLPIVFGVVRKREVKNLHSNNSDFKYFCRKLVVEGLSTQLVVLGENEETANFLLEDGVKQTMNKFEKSLQMLFITDQKSVLNSPLTLRLMFNLQGTDPKVMEECSLLLKLAFFLVDRLSNYQLSSTNLAKAEKERQHVEEIRRKDEKEKRKEELLNKKLEKKKQDEEKLKSLPPEKRKKMEEKEQRETLKKKYPRKIMKF